MGAKCKPIKVDLWSLKFDQDALNIDQNLFLHILSNEERVKAEKYRKYEDRVRYTISHAFLRLVLSTQLDVYAKTLHFATSITGKPYIDSRYGLKFNLSHSYNYTLVASSQNEPGVDIEYHKQIKKLDDLVRFVMTKNELHSWYTLLQQNLTKSFYDWWTLKEALLKCIGEGITGEQFSKVQILPHLMKSTPSVFKINQIRCLIQSVDLGSKVSIALAVKEASQRGSSLSVQLKEISLSGLLIALNQLNKFENFHLLLKNQKAGVF